MSPRESTAFDGEPDDWLDKWTGDIEKRTAQARALSDQVAQLQVSASSSEGAIEVTVAGSGAMTSLRLSEAIRRWPADELAAQIMAVMGRAQAKLSARVAEIAADTVGADSPAARAVVTSFEKRYPYPQSDGDDVETGSASDWRRRGR